MSFAKKRAHPYGWFMKFKDLANTATYRTGINEIYTPPTNEVTISGNSIFTPFIRYGVFYYYDTVISKHRFFFTDAIIQENELASDSKTFTFSAIDTTTFKSTLGVNN